eukprot:9469711-Pyramimonas_sp.AAC.1
MRLALRATDVFPRVLPSSPPSASRKPCRSLLAFRTCLRGGVCSDSAPVCWIERDPKPSGTSLSEG